MVIDASISLCWAFSDEDQPLASRALALTTRQGASVPAVWWYELRNGLLQGERRKRLEVSETQVFLQQLVRLPIEVRFEANEPGIWSAARTYRLTFHDAAYLELAARLRAPLATLDRRLAEAAEAAGVEVL